MTTALRADAATGEAFLQVNNNDRIKIAANGDMTLLSGNLLLANGVVKQAPSKAPAFVVNLSSNQPISASVYTRVLPNRKVLDPTNAFDLASGKFLPLVGGWYDVKACFTLDGSGSGDNMQGNIFKNGASHKRLWVDNTSSSSNIGVSQLGGSALVYLNGSTDYIDFWVYIGNKLTPVIAGSSAGEQSFASAHLVIPD